VVTEDRVAVLARDGRELAVRAAGDVVDPEIPRDRGRVVLAPRVLLALPVLVDEEAPVRAHVDRLRGRGQELDRTPAFDGDLIELRLRRGREYPALRRVQPRRAVDHDPAISRRSEGHTSELQSRE